MSKILIKSNSIFSLTSTDSGKSPSRKMKTSSTIPSSAKTTSKCCTLSNASGRASVVEAWVMMVAAWAFSKALFPQTTLCLLQENSFSSKRRSLHPKWISQMNFLCSVNPHNKKITKISFAQRWKLWATFSASLKGSCIIITRLMHKIIDLWMRKPVVVASIVYLMKILMWNS